MTQDQYRKLRESHFEYSTNIKLERMTQPICIYCGKTQQQHSAFNYCRDYLGKDTTFKFNPEKEPAVDVAPLAVFTDATNLKPIETLWLEELTKLLEDKQELVEGLRKFTILNPDHYRDIAGLIKSAQKLIEKHGK